MGIEIERKFLVDPTKLPPLTGGVTIEQGYLSEDPVVRVRTKTKGFTTKAYLTIKGPGTLQRAEFEWEIPTKEAQEILGAGLWQCALVKTRYCVGRWEIDCFLGELEGLYLAEIELQSPDEVVEIPEWCIEEVTETPGYDNFSLAQDGLPEHGNSPS